MTLKKQKKARATIPSIPWDAVEKVLEEFGKTTKWLREQLDVSPSVLTNWKSRGIPSGWTLNLCNVLGITPQRLVVRSVQEGNNQTHADITRFNARYIAEQEGGLAAFGRKLGMSDTQVSQIIGSNPRRNIGRGLARRIEKAFGKELGWLDQPQAGSVFVAQLDTHAQLEMYANAMSKAAACLRASLSAPENDKSSLVELALAQLDAVRASSEV